MAKRVSPIKKTIKKNIAVSTIRKKPLSPEKLKWTCPPSLLKFKSTKEIKPLDIIVGQPRAIESIKLGAELFSKGYNIFVTGLAGTGRLTTVKKILESVTTVKPKTYDYCYVNNFSNPDEPILIKLPSAKGSEFSKSMEDAITFFRRKFPKMFEEENFKKIRKKIVDEYQKKEQSITDRFDKKIKPKGFIRGQLETEQGVIQPEVFPIIDDKPVQIETIDSMVQKGEMSIKKAETIKKDYLKFHQEIFELSKQGLKIMQAFKKALLKNDRALASIFIDSVFEEITNLYKNEKVNSYIDELKNYIVENISIFVRPDSLEGFANDNNNKSKPEDIFRLFSVNVVLDNSKTKSAPLILETTPTYTNLFGTIERFYDNSGYWRTDFTKIKAGALLRADQGYLIVNALDIFQEQGVWQALKRVLLYDKLEIQPYEAIFQLSQLHMKPESIDVNVKVVVIGGQSLYQWLYAYEKGFKKIFKINAQFDYETARSNSMIRNISKFISKICMDEDLPHFSPDAVGSIVEWAVEHAGSQNRITLKFSDIADIIREAAYFDKVNKKNKKRLIARDDVLKAIDCRRRRNGLIDDKLTNHILQGTILIDTTGERCGQINGLTVLDTGLISFGKPARITASISAGDSGIINIEREVDMSGSIHNKGVLIISGFLRERFAQQKPMTLSASIAFEQNYGGIDGDSASAAEIYVLLSAIANIPIKQSIAITGSVNQKGDIQPIGGVNDKIRGFFGICKERGLTGEHGVIIPIQNVIDLMLPDEIITAVKDKKFAIYPIAKIEEGTEIMLGIKAGELNEDGCYPENTLFRIVADRLEELRKVSQKKSSKRKTKRKKVSADIKKEVISLEEILQSEEI